jgi:hypothetical protein
MTALSEGSRSARRQCAQGTRAQASGGLDPDDCFHLGARTRRAIAMATTRSPARTLSSPIAGPTRRRAESGDCIGAPAGSQSRVWRRAGRLLRRSGVPLSTQHACAPRPWLACEALRLDQDRARRGSSWWLVSPGVARAVRVQPNAITSLMLCTTGSRGNGSGADVPRAAFSAVCRGYRTQLWSTRKPQAGWNW